MRRRLPKCKLSVFLSVAPEISVPSQLYGVGPATDVTVSCRVQAYPSAINYWVKDQVSYPSVYGQ